MADSTKQYLVVGLGVSGMSVVRYLSRINASFDVVEGNVDRFNDQLRTEPGLKGVRHYSDDLTVELLSAYDCIVVSPGMSVRSAVFKQATAVGVEVIGDVELFARAVIKPVIAVTGSNGKSTVVSMAGELFRAAGINAAVIGNVGFACLDSLQDQSIELYVLELSSFQLETTFSLRPRVATVLNITADHLDRYEGLEDYADVKRNIYHNAQHVVCNLNDSRTFPVDSASFASAVTFSAENPEADWSVTGSAEGGYFLSGGSIAQIPVADVKVAGIHNRINALVAMAMTSLVIEADKKAMGDIFRTGFANFNGLPHRTQLVCEADNICWINDSKGTNVGATVSAIKGMSAPVVLIAGGRGKNTDYAPLRDAVAEFCTSVILIGEDAQLISTVLNGIVPVYIHKTMQSAVQCASEISRPGDCVLLSPACASFDMFSNFEERGEAFEIEAKKQCA